MKLKSESRVCVLLTGTELISQIPGLECDENTLPCVCVQVWLQSDPYHFWYQATWCAAFILVCVIQRVFTAGGKEIHVKEKLYLFIKPGCVCVCVLSSSLLPATCVFVKLRKGRMKWRRRFDPELGSLCWRERGGDPRCNEARALHAALSAHFRVPRLHRGITGPVGRVQVSWIPDDFCSLGPHMTRKCSFMVFHSSILLFWLVCSWFPVFRLAGLLMFTDVMKYQFCVWEVWRVLTHTTASNRTKATEI